MSDVKNKALRLRPIVQVPRRARPGGKYLMTIDLEPVDPEHWPYEQEECVLTLILDTMPLFEHYTLGEPAVVLHRFGGTYGAARYVLQASEEEVSGEIRVTLLGESGLPLETFSIPSIRIESGTTGVTDRKDIAVLDTKSTSRSIPFVNQPDGHESDLDGQSVAKEGSNIGALQSVTAYSRKSFAGEENWPGVDLVLDVTNHWKPEGLILEYNLHSPAGVVSLPEEPIYSRPIGVPEDFRQDLLKKLELLHTKLGVDEKSHFLTEVQSTLENIGHELYDRLFPRSFREVYRQFRDVTRTLLVISEDPWIPWELVKPFDDSSDDDFFCLQFEMSRWLPEAPVAPTAKGVRKVACLSADRLPGVRAELQMITDLVGDVPGVILDKVEGASYEMFMELLEGDLDLLHLVGGVKDTEAGAELAKIELAGRSFRAHQLSGHLAEHLQQTCPIVFINSSALESHRTKRKTDIGSWAEGWIRRGGASVFLAPVWPVGERSASEFSSAFYRSLQSGVCLGESVRLARRELLANDPLDLSWLAYRIYGHPDARIVFGSPLKFPEYSWHLDRSPPGALLRAEYGVVPFHFREEEIEDLDAWCLSEEKLAIRLYTGAGGMGKTRIALEVCRKRCGEGWQAGFVDTSLPPQETWRLICKIGGPRLLVFDYAETKRSRLVPFLQEIFKAGDDTPIRVLLLARAATDWWEQLKTEGEGVGDLLSGPATRWRTLQPLAFSTADRAESYRVAAGAFAGELNKQVPKELPTDLNADHYQRVLLLHISALAAVEGIDVQGEDGILDYVLSRERRFWHRLADERALAPEVVAGIGRVMAAITLGGGADDEEKAVLAMRGLRFFQEEKESVLTSVARLLHEAYPGENRWIDPVMPDLLGEHLVMRELEKGADELFDLVLGSAPDISKENQSNRIPVESRAEEVEPLIEIVKSGALENMRETLTQLTRLAQRRPEAAVWLEHALEERLEDVARIALDVVVETGDPLGKIIAKIVENGGSIDLHEELMNISNEEKYRSSVPLQEVALVATMRTVQAHRTRSSEPDTEQRSQLARMLNNLSSRLAALGRREEALAAALEAVDIWRHLTNEHPDAFRSDFATSLDNLGVRLYDVGRIEEALTTTREALEIQRQLASPLPDSFLPGLATSLGNLGIHLSGTGRQEEALEATLEAVTIQRELAVSRPVVNRQGLARSLGNLATHLADLGRREEAIEAAREAVEIYRQCAEDRPDIYLPNLATSLNNLGSRSHELGRREDALEAYGEATEIQRQLVTTREIYRVELAKCLDSMCIEYSALGRWLEALEAVREAVGLHRELAARSPELVHDLAAGLDNLSIVLSELNQVGEAYEASSEAVAIRRQKVDGHPASLPWLAGSLSNLAGRLLDLNRLDEALAVLHESVDIRRELVAREPDTYLPELARSLHNMGGALSMAGRLEQALTVTEEAVDIRRRLAESHPESFTPELARSLYNLGLRRKATGRLREALGALRESVDLQQQLEAEYPGASLWDLAKGLHEVGIVLSSLDHEEEALQFFQEAVDLQQRVVEESPSVVLPDLAESFDQLSKTLQELGRNTEAVAVLERAIQSFATFLPDHAEALGPYPERLAKRRREWRSY